MGLHVDGQTLTVESTHFTARFEGAALTSVIHRGSETEFLRSDGCVFPLQLTYLNQDVLSEDKHQAVVLKQLSPIAVRIIVIGEDSDRELLVRLDPSTGDLCVRPAGQSARRGVVSVRWDIPFAGEASLVLPLVNGAEVQTGRKLPSSHRYAWPCWWNAQLTIAERNGASMMIHSEDTARRFKALDLRRNDEGLTTLGFEAEQLGPLWQNRTAGGVEWRINTYDGDWRVPATRYRTWLGETHGLAAKRANRPPWVDDIKFAVCWAHSNPDLLDELAELHPPEETLIHLSHWRTNAYDVGYPDYTPTEQARTFLAKANGMGFRVMPHFNYFACYDEHPDFQRVRDWQIRTPYINEPDGWYWPPETHDQTRMGYIHPGLSLWRRTLVDAVMEASEELRAPAIFIDQTLLTLNCDNGLVENMNTIEGMQEMHEEFVGIKPEVVLVGECLNDMSFHHECFAQAHIFDGFRKLTPDHAEMVHPICAFLWEGHTRLIGYHHLRPDDDMDLAVEAYRRMGAIPTLVPGRFGDPKTDIDASHPAVQRVLKLVKS